MSNTGSMQWVEELTKQELPLEKANILVVDDEPLSRRLICDALAADDYRIVEMESGEAAVEYIAHHDADLILLDIHMPGMGGFAACAAIRALPHGKLLSIAMVTGSDDAEAIESAFDCGATDFLTKPINRALMRQRVRFMLRHGGVALKLHRNEQILEQVHEIAAIGHWQWDFANHTIYLSEQYRRILPGLPERIDDSILDTVLAATSGQFILGEIRRALDNGSPDFQFECSFPLPDDSKRRLLYHGTIEYDDGKPLRLLSTVQDITVRAQEEERFAVIFNESPVGIIEADCSRLINLIQQPGFSNCTDKQLRATIAELLTKNQDNSLFIKANPAAQRILPHNQHHPLLMKLRSEITFHFLTALRDDKQRLLMTCQLPLNDNTIRDVIISAHLPINIEDYKHLVISINDVTDLNRHTAQLRRADAIIANSSDAVALFDRNRQVYAINPAYTKVTGYTLEHVQTMDMLIQLPASSRDRIVAIIHETLKRQDYWRGEVEFQRCDGSLMPAIVQINVIRNDCDEFDGCVTITTDISHIKESERRLHQLAHFDALTDLPNRLSLQERLQTEFEDTTENGSFCLLYIDLDGFKLINDSMGHSTGDTLLREVSARLRTCCRRGDLLARIGGDEFALLMTAAMKDEIDDQANRILAALNTPFNIKNRDLFIGASIGACLYPEDATSAEKMLRNADSAMYEAKRRGRGQLCYYSTQLTSDSNHRLQVENELRIAIHSAQLFLVYQPKYDAFSGAIVGVEALVRWRNPKRGIVPPNEFIGIAETCGLIIPLGEWVINEACRQLAEWQHNYGFSLPVAINISALHLREQSLLRVISEAIAHFHIDPHLLEMEITEDSLDFRGEDDKPYILLKQLSEIGLSIAIDDFGTGYSSLSQLKKMPISTLKIDMSFVRDIVVSESDHAIITAIVGLAKTLGMSIVAEGVETEEQAERLRLLKCDVLQGYLYSKPVSPAELVQKLNPADL